MRAPLVRRSRLEAERARRRELVAELEDRIAELHHTVARARDDREKSMKGAQAAQARADDAFRDCGKLITDLRAVIWHVSDRLRYDDRRLSFMLEIPSELLWHSFYRDATFRQALAYSLERLIYETPELRSHILAGPPPR